MTVDLTLRLHRFKLIPILYHLSLQAKSKDGRETMVMEHFPEMDPTNTDPHIVSLIGLKSLSDPNPSFEGGKRKGSIAIYLEPWHADVFEFLELRKNSGNEEVRCRDLFTALWVPDLFIKRVESDGTWSLFDPDKARGLPDCYGEEFEELYERYEATPGLASKVVRAKALWSAMLTAQVEGGTPYVLYKDAVNRKSNQKHLGTIKSSNLCAEITEFTSKDETAVCTLASLSLPQFVALDDENKPTFDMRKLREVTKVVIRNLDLSIDRSFYPTPEAKRSNMRHRPLGLGVQGLADVFMMLRLPFSSPGARALNSAIFQSIYYAAVEASVELAEEKGAYETFQGSPSSKGLLQFDLWEKKPAEMGYDWAGLKERVKKSGMRNSLLTCVMPTASTGHLLGNVEAAEALSSNLYVRRTLAGEFVVANNHLMADLVRLGLWNDHMKDQIMANRGSIQAIPEIPDDLKELYKTVWQIKQRVVIDLAADRGIFIDQSQSMNLFWPKPTPGALSSALVYGHKKGLKTSLYYLRTNPSTVPTAVTAPLKKGKKDKQKEKGEDDGQDKDEMAVICNDEVCVGCSG
ncbi:ribonucleoside-diphosphate reductase [Klebsormidium nitens]|uniref:Ribonucleoside-diphosphate reductase n=1 Tax=Klebsormidium nitens TaxID=105231 RepID=A0A1Y1ILE7_KLENI|nr:ribonucleoside-diphosphate reductase [Klebsormidium nitens]|eukprot:GAQ91624.1 ribonucleoside-diphosphate reductase [Klebsormidium nitens]